MADGPMPTEGVDYAWSRPNIGLLAAAGKRFACRYGGPGSDGKQLDPAEAQALAAAGVAIVANAEGSAGGLAGGWSVGVDWARDAEAHFAACGMPAGRPIYLSVDFDVTSSQWPSVAGALRGAASVLGGVHRVGVYGGRRAIEWARRDGVAAWFWQTYAWSGGVWVPGNHIEQHLNGVALAGATLDLDRSLTSDFGQWTIGEVDMTPAESAAFDDLIWRVDALWSNTDLRGGRYVDDPALNQNMLKDAIENVSVPELTDEQLEAIAVQAGEQAAALIGGKLDAVLAALAANRSDARDAVADLGEGGAEKVRAES